MCGMMISSSEVDEDIQFASVKSGKAWIRQVTLQEEKEKRLIARWEYEKRRNANESEEFI